MNGLEQIQPALDTHLRQLVGQAQRVSDAATYSASRVLPFKSSRRALAAALDELRVTKVNGLRIDPSRTSPAIVVDVVRNDERQVVKIGGPANEPQAMRNSRLAGARLVPEVLAEGITEGLSGREVSYYAMPWIEGIEVKQGIAPRTVMAALRVASEQIARIHDAPLLGINSAFGNAKDIASLRQFVARIEPDLPPGASGWIDAIEETAWEHVHSWGGAHLSNVILDVDTKQPVALLDVEGVALPRHADCALLITELGIPEAYPQFSKVVLDAYPALDAKVLDLWIGYSTLRRAEAINAVSDNYLDSAFVTLREVWSAAEMIKHGSALRRRNSIIDIDAKLKFQEQGIATDLAPKQFATEAADALVQTTDLNLSL